MCTFMKYLFDLVAGASIILAELALEVGLPNGVLNIVHGTDVSCEFFYQEHISLIAVLLILACTQAICLHSIII